jgi:hypothetical protein
MLVQSMSSKETSSLFTLKYADGRENPLRCRVNTPRSLTTRDNQWKRAKNENKHLTENTQMVNKPMKQCSTSLVFMEMHF